MSQQQGGQQAGQQQQQHQQELLDDQPRYHQTTAGGLHHTSSSPSLPSGLATPIRLQHHRASASRLQEFTGHHASSSSSSSVLGDAWTTGDGWRHLTAAAAASSSSSSASPSRTRSRSSPHWSSESLLKDARWSEPPPPPPPSSSSQVQQQQQHLQDADREPFIPPPPLLDFETANLLPPLGVDVSSPSDDVHFVPSSNDSQQQQQQQQPPLPPSQSSDWAAHVPPQYATLRRPGRSQIESHYPSSSSSSAAAAAAARRPNNRQHNPHQHLTSPSWLDAPDPHEPPGSVSSSSSSSCHRTDAVGRKCTCGQKMRLNNQQQQHQQQQHDSHIRSDDGLAGIATLRRPMKRKGRHPLPASSGVGGGGAPSSGQQAVTAAAAAALLQQPKLETSLLLDKLLRAGALRPEDYLVLSRMERMIMANHAAAGQSSSSVQQSTNGGNFGPAVRSNRSSKSSSSGPSVNSTPDYEAVRSHPLASSENLYDTGASSSIYGGRRSSAGGPDMPTAIRQQAIQRPSPGPSPFDYYSSMGYAGRESGSAGQSGGAVPRTTNAPELSLYSSAYQQAPTSAGPAVQQPAGRCCPCCGSPSHPHVHHHCTLCGSEAGHANGTSSSSSSSSAAAGQSYSASYAAKIMTQQQQQQQQTGTASPAPQTYYPTAGRHYPDQIVPGSVAKYPATLQPSPSQSAMILGGKAPGQGSSASLVQQQQQQTSQPGLRTELHPLPSTEPLRFTMAAPNGPQQIPPSLHRSISSPAQPPSAGRVMSPPHQPLNPIPESQVVGQQHLQSSAHRTAGQVNPRVGLSRSLSRTEAVKEYLKQSAATFFGLDESKESELRQRWEERRRRLAERRCGNLREEPDNDAGLDVVDAGHIPLEGAESTDSVLRASSSSAMRASAASSQLPGSRCKRRESVARMTWDGLAYLATAVVRWRTSGAGDESASVRSRSVSAPRTGDTLSTNGVAGSASSRSAALPPDVTMDTPAGAADAALDDEVFFDSPPPPYEDVVDAPPPSAASSATALRTSADVRPSRWRRAVPAGQAAPSASLVDRLMDNSNRRQFGMGVVGRITRRSLRRSMMDNNKHLKRQLDSFEDHRPYFTYWACTVQVLVMFIALITYGVGPVGFNLHRRSGSVLVTSLSLQEVDYHEPSNFWIGPRAADLIHLGAKFSPCMKLDTRIQADIEAARNRERQTACCIRNDNSGCVQTSRAECSDLTSTWKKWNVVQSGPGGRISGSVCGQDPNFCIEPASVAPFEWPDDITKWPKCRKKLPGLGSESMSKANHVLKTTGQAEHMVCEVIGHPCCIGIFGECRIATREYCDFVKGYFHQEASLCSQVSCMNDVCGMLPFHVPDVPDQFYRLWTSLFLHAGLLHLVLSISFQMVVMRDLEKLAGPVRIGIIYLGSGVVGNLASALFEPYRAEVGPSGSHFGLLACLCVEVLHAWPLLKTPWRALGRLLLMVAFLFVAGLLPWVDNFAHIFGFISGGLLSYTFLPFITVGTYDRRRKLVLIGVTLTLACVLMAALVLLLYVWPIQDARVIQTLSYLNCVPITRDFCAVQNIHFDKREIHVT